MMVQRRRSLGYPGRIKINDNIDNDCDGVVDEGEDDTELGACGAKLERTARHRFKRRKTGMCYILVETSIFGIMYVADNRDSYFATTNRR